MATAKRVAVLSRHVSGSDGPSAGAVGSESTDAAAGAGAGAGAGSCGREATAAGTFRYTVDRDSKGVLTDEQRRHYEEHGFLVFRKLVSEDKLERYRQRYEVICKGDTFRGPFLQVVRDVALAKAGLQATCGDQVTKIQSYEDDEVLFEYPQLPEIINIVKAFVGQNVKSVHTMLINKPPDPGAKSSRHPLHQDLHYFPFRPTDRICAAWTAMQHVHRENGCLVVIPGSHKGGKLLEHVYPDWGEGKVNKAYHGIKDYDESWAKKLVYLEMQPGDTVFFHPLLIHGSGSNRTKGFRKAISCHYASSSCHYIEVRGTSQEDLAKEIEGVAARKGVDIDYLDVWKYKSRLVAGLAGTL